MIAAQRTRRTNLAIDVFLWAFSLFMLLPLILLVANAFKTPEEMIAWPPTIIPADPTLENFTSVLKDTPLLRWIGNSLGFAIMSSIAIVATSSIAGYVVGKFRYRTINVVFFLFLATAVIPFEVYMIPLYFQVKDLGGLNTVWGLLIGYLVMSFGIFLIRQNVNTAIPDELIEAARIDGASETWIFFHIALPLLRGPLAALGVLAFFQAWTAFAWPMIVATKRGAYTIEVGLAQFQTGYTIDLGRLSAASAAVLIPSVLTFVLLRRNFVEGISASGMKE